MLWLTLTIISYFCSAVASVVDKILLSGPIPKPKIYAFYVGILGILALVLIPFGFQVPPLQIIFLALFAGSIWMVGMMYLFKGLRQFEASRIIPAIGGFLPLFTLGFVHFFSWQAKISTPLLTSWRLLSFILLISGSVLINLQKDKHLTAKSLVLSLWTAFLLGLSFTATKIVFLNQSFISGIIWTRIGVFLVALALISSKEVQEEIFFKKRGSHQPMFKKPKLALVFLANQAVGAISGILQGLAIYLVPLGMLAFVNALEGTKYVFVLLLIILLSLKLPKILSETLSKKVILQKIIATILIVCGLTILYCL